MKLMKDLRKKWTVTPEQQLKLQEKDPKYLIDMPTFIPKIVFGVLSGAMIYVWVLYFMGNMPTNLIATIEFIAMSIVVFGLFLFSLIF